ncbi:zinc-binding dehydrogenase [Vibrio alginolyticus]|nr:zinc-binding dehydrogenase [Vibrio alginolyticus]
MKAIGIKAHGSVDVLQEIEVEAPTAKFGHVVIDVKATSVNPVDTKIRQGSEGTAGMSYPAILHMDVSGVISEVGEGVTNFKVGDEVYGCVGGIVGLQGTLAEKVEADAVLLAHKPKTLSFGEAASLPLVAITAWEAIVDRAQITPNDKVLVHGGTGGVGHIGVQLAKVMGAHVSTTVADEERAAIAKSLGADETILFTEEEPNAYVERLTDGKGFDTIFDTVGGPVLQNSLIATKLKGHVISTIGYADYNLTEMHFKALRLDLVFMAISLIHDIDRETHGEILRRLANLVDKGDVKPLIDSIHPFTLEGVKAAHTRLESGKATGKVVIER